jgi:hypothetical protein
MRKLFIAIALVTPALGHAALVIEDGKANTPQPLSAPAYPSATAALAAAKATPAVTYTQPAPPTQVLPSDSPPSSTGLVIAPIWQVTPTDATLQRLFVRWAKDAGWSSIWDSDQDIPLIATAQFAGSFTDAVQAVLHTTESTDVPLHPCFYTNNVVRVVPIATTCDPDKDSQL